MKLVVYTLCLAVSVFVTPLSADYADSILSITPGASRLVDPVFRALDTSLFTGKYSICLTPIGSYAAAKAKVTAQKDRIKQRLVSKTPSDSLYRLAQTALEQCILDELIPFWYGTPWDFNGYTAQPKKGVIACGYFVSTVLLHCGFNLNRYTLAQQYPYLEAVSLQLNDSIGEFHSGAGNFLQEFKQQYKEGLYFVGLDYHVGFLLLRNNDVLFLHASYFSPKCVTIERAVVSEAFNASTTYYIAELSTNRKLLDCWLNSTKINIRTE